HAKYSRYQFLFPVSIYGIHSKSHSRGIRINHLLYNNADAQTWTEMVCLSIRKDTFRKNGAPDTFYTFQYMFFFDVQITFKLSGKRMLPSIFVQRRRTYCQISGLSE